MKIRIGALLLASAAALAAQTGVAVLEFASLDRDIQALLRKTGVPGSAVAIAKDGRLVFARGYGVADMDTAEPVQPDSLFRVGSISKTFTAVALLNLYENGRLDLDAKVYSGILTDLRPPSALKVDPRVWNITVRQLLHHTGGHGRDTGVDPLTPDVVMEAARVLGVPAPASPENIVRYAMSQPLDFDPGQRYSYSNYGFMTLARVVERLAGQPYGSFVQQHVFAPMGIRRAALGGAFPEGRLPGEVRYYELPRPIFELSLIPGVHRLLPRPYANFGVLAADGCGQWVASPIDLVRFVSTVEGGRSPAFLKPATFDLMLERPDPFVSQDSTGASWYALGTGASTWGAGRSWQHSGAYYGNFTTYVSFGNGIVFAAAFNAWPANYDGFLADVYDILTDFCLSQQNWPAHDLFPNYYPEN
jgi:N-acyl-D-amino-acid deacylase